MTQQPPGSSAPRRVCDYEGSPYRTVFWGDSDRRYEDAAERLALRAMLPPTGDRLIDIGAGFGRLADEYAGYERPVLLDYAHSMLVDARRRLGDRCTYVCADLYRLPIATSSVDAVVEVRVLHHVEDVPAAFAEVARVLRAGGTYVLEHANKRHLKAIAQHLAGRRPASPFDHAPYEFVPLNWDLHPAFVEEALRGAGLVVRGRRSASLLRVPLVKAVLPPRALARLDFLLGGPTGRLALGPSQFVRATRLTGRPATGGLYRCPRCGHEPLEVEDRGVSCSPCGRLWPERDGVLVFREDAP